MFDSTRVRQSSRILLTVGVLLALVACTTQNAKSPKAQWADDRMELMAHQQREQEERIDKLLRTVETLNDQVQRLRSESITKTAVIEKNTSDPAAVAAQKLESEEPRPEILPKSAPQGQAIASSAHESLHSYYAGLKAIEDKDYDAAVNKFRRFLEDAPTHVYSDRAQFLIQKSHYLNGDFSLAIVAGNALLAKYPKSIRIPDGLYYKALALSKSGNLRDGRETLEELVQSFPQHSLHEQALKMLSEWKTKGSARVESIPLLESAVETQ